MMTWVHCFLLDGFSLTVKSGRKWWTIAQKFFIRHSRTCTIQHCARWNTNRQIFTHNNNLNAICHDLFHECKSFSTTYFGSVLDNRQAGGGHLINCAVADTKYKYINFKTQQQQEVLQESKIRWKMLKSTFYEIFWNWESKENKNKAHVLILNNNKYYIINVTIFKKHD